MTLRNSESTGTGSEAARGALGPGQVALRFYDAFVQRRVDELEPLYAHDAKFRDAVFDCRDRTKTMKMWRTLLGGAAGAEFRYTLDRVDGDVAYGHWVADYRLFGRRVRNEVESRLTVRDGRIVDHEDRFSWSRWARQAFPLGPLVDLAPVRFVLVRALRAMVRLAPVPAARRPSDRPRR